MRDLVAIIITLGVVVAAALIALILVRRGTPYARLAPHSNVAGYVYAVLGVVYGVILAQVVVAAWDQYQTAEAVANDEADAVLSLARLAQVLPAEERHQVIAALQAYAQNVIAVEWPAMKSGNLETTFHSPLVHQLWQAVLAASTRSGAVNAISTEMLQQLDSVSDARRARVFLSDSGLPMFMRLTLIAGAAITVGFSYLLIVEDSWVQGVITVSLTALVALLLLLEYQLETPFQGVSAIEPSAMSFVQTEIDVLAVERSTPP